VLVLSGIELVFFTLASPGLRFGFVINGAMFWICAKNSVDNTEMFSLLLRSAYTVPRSFLLLTLPHQQVGSGGTISWEGTQLGQLAPTDQKGYSIQ